MRICMQGLSLDSNEIREYTYGAFSNIASILKADMAPLAVAIMPKLLLSCDSEDGIDLLKGGDAFNGLAGEAHRHPRHARMPHRALIGSVAPLSRDFLARTAALACGHIASLTLCFRRRRGR